MNPDVSRQGSIMLSYQTLGLFGAFGGWGWGVEWKGL